MSRRYIERVILGEERGAFSWLVRVVFLPFSVIYRIGLAVFLAPYQLGIRKKYRLKVPVISVGNLTFGGTGKTPAVQTICRILRDNGRRVIVLSRGHGGLVKGATVVSDGENVLLAAAEAGDEPVLLARSLPGVPVVVGKDRRVSGDLALKRFNPDVVVLDDGMQYWQLHRDLDIVVMNASRPFGSGFVMPMGDLREPVKGLRRARVVLLNTGGAADVEKTELQIKRLAPKAEVFRCCHKPERFISIKDGKTFDFDWIRGRKVLGFCGIGRPQSFFGMLDTLGASLVRQIIFSDHHNYLQEDISQIENERRSSSAEAVVTTLKDIARLNDKYTIEDLFALEIRLDIEDNCSFADRIDIKN